MAEDIVDHIIKANILEVAAAYDRMADRIEKHSIINNPDDQF
ncbi:MAG TPA: hypothetical protein VNF99_10540 [Stellaceae bacterium]|nr:hypothetical protein [Stellaceae bacterium]